MCISSETLSEIEVALEEFQKITENPMALLRNCFPALSFVRLAASDIEEEPYRQLPNFNLYLLDASEHCVHITSSLDGARRALIASR
jgi:hypothetical protein